MLENNWDDLPNEIKEFQREEEEKEEYINSIVNGMLEGCITHSNFSPTNNLDTVEQLLLFKFGYMDEEELTDILDRIGESYINNVKKMMNGEIIRIVDFTYEKDAEFEVFKKKLVRKISNSVFRGEITCDNISRYNGLNSLEQIILFLFKCTTQEKEEIQEEVLARVMTLGGGCNMDNST